MAGYIGYNPWSDASGAIGSGGDALGSAILRSALMKQQQAQQQQQLMIELQRLQMEQQSAKDLNTYRSGELDLGKQRFAQSQKEYGDTSDLAERAQAIKDREEVMRQKFGSSMRMEGVGSLPIDYGAPTVAGVGQYNQQRTQADQNESAAYLSHDPSNAIDTILKMQAARAQPVAGNPLLQQELITGRGPHNVPSGSIAVSPLGGPAIATGPDRQLAGDRLSYNAIEAMYRDAVDQAGGYDSAMTENPDFPLMQKALLLGLRERMGTNAPSAQPPPNKNEARVEAKRLIQQYPEKAQAIQLRFQQTFNEKL